MHVCSRGHRTPLCAAGAMGVRGGAGMHARGRRHSIGINSGSGWSGFCKPNPKCAPAGGAGAFGLGRKARKREAAERRRGAEKVAQHKAEEVDAEEEKRRLKVGAGACIFVQGSEWHRVPPPSGCSSRSVCLNVACSTTSLLLCRNIARL